MLLRVFVVKWMEPAAKAASTGSNEAWDEGSGASNAVLEALNGGFEASNGSFEASDASFEASNASFEG